MPGHPASTSPSAIMFIGSQLHARGMIAEVTWTLMSSEIHDSTNTHRFQGHGKTSSDCFYSSTDAKVISDTLQTPSGSRTGFPSSPSSARGSINMRRVWLRTCLDGFRQWRILPLTQGLQGAPTQRVSPPRVLAICNHARAALASNGLCLAAPLDSRLFWRTLPVWSTDYSWYARSAPEWC